MPLMSAALQEYRSLDDTAIFCGLHCAKKPVITKLTYPWKCTVLRTKYLETTSADDLTL